MIIFSQLWERLSGAARIGLVACAVVLLGATMALAVWLLRPDYQVLFGDLTQSDAAAMTAELDKMKIPYKLDGGGNTILVPGEQVYKTRLKLVGRDLPLHGTVGFELFNNNDIGMTDFAQKVNYQRALQGELTRTVLAIEEIQAARIHLALPEQTLFKKSSDQAKASVSLTLKPGKTLQPSQVQGIQRLISASVPEIHLEDVTVIDQHGVALTRSAGQDDVLSGSANLDGKQALESYLSRKVTDVLDRTFGAGQSYATVDVIFNRDSTKVTTENVLGSPTDSASGVVVHEREVSHDTNSDASANQAHPAVAANINREVDYQVGRRVEQTVSTPGAVSRINVAVVVHQMLDAAEIERIRDIVTMAAGIDKARGDGIAVYSISQLANTPSQVAALAMPMSDGTPSTPAPIQNTSLAPLRSTMTINPVSHDGMFFRQSVSTPILAISCTAVLGIAMLLFWRVRQKMTGRSQLSQQEREELLLRVRHWLDEKPVKQGSRV